MNDVAPQIRINTLTPHGEAEVLEHAEVGTFVAHLSVEDPDMGGRQQFECDIDNSNFRLREMSDPSQNKEYTIVTTREFDREDSSGQLPEYSVVLACHDFGDPRLESVEQIHVNIVDINDNAPVFTPTHYVETVPEGSDVGRFVARITASDADSGLNQKLRYQLLPATQDDVDAIVIDADTGIVSVNRDLDYEDRTSYSYTVLAQDSGNPALTATATLNITVADVNDEPPQFDTDRCELQVVENGDDVALVKTFTATDRDEEPYDVITFDLDFRQSGSEDFRIDQLSGVLYTSRPLDRERRAEYDLTVIARNDASPTAPQSTLHCSVTVLDVNDNAPVIDFPSDHNNSLTVSNLLPLDSIVTRVLARDADVGINAQLRFAIIAGNDDGYFRIDEDSGEIALASDVSHLQRHVVTLQVTVSDRGQPPEYDRRALVLTIDSTAAASGSSTMSGAATVTLAVILVIVALLLVTVTSVVCVLRRRRRRHDSRKEKDVACQLGAHDTLRGSSASSSNNGDVSINSESTLHYVRDGSQSTFEKTDSVSFTFDRENAYMQQRSLSTPTSSEPRVSGPRFPPIKLHRFPSRRLHGVQNLITVGAIMLQCESKLFPLAFEGKPINHKP